MFFKCASEWEEEREIKWELQQSWVFLTKHIENGGYAVSLQGNISGFVMQSHRSRVQDRENDHDRSSRR